MALMFPSKTRRASRVSLEALVVVAGTEAVRAQATRNGTAKATRTWRRVMALFYRHREIPKGAARRSQFAVLLQSDCYPQSIRDEVGLTANRIEEDFPGPVLLNASFAEIARFAVGVILRADVERQWMPASLAKRDVEAPAGCP